VYLEINEDQSRYLFENLILAGISIGGCKPNFKSFLNPNVIQLKKLEYGISISLANPIKDQWRRYSMCKMCNAHPKKGNSTSFCAL